MTQASNLRPITIWGHKTGQNISEPMSIKHPAALFHKFERYDAICELPDGKVTIVAAWQVQFTDTEAT